MVRKAKVGWLMVNDQQLNQQSELKFWYKKLDWMCCNWFEFNLWNIGIHLDPVC